MQQGLFNQRRLMRIVHYATDIPHNTNSTCGRHSGATTSGYSTTATSTATAATATAAATTPVPLPLLPPAQCRQPL
jgi:hypothetical protein